MPKYDVIIKSHPKDYLKLKYAVDSVRYLNPQPEGIYIVTPDGSMPKELKHDPRIVMIKDKDALPTLDRDKIKYRPNWTWAMLVGLFQNITPNDYYFDIQSDCFFIKEVDLFTSEDKPIFFVSPQHRHYHVPYFKFNSRVLNLPDRPDVTRQYGFHKMDSFVIDYMMYSRQIAQEMLIPLGGLEGFFNVCYDIISRQCNLGDYEIYPLWCLTRHPDLYAIKTNVNVRVTGKDYPDTYNDEQIIEEINLTKTNTEAVSVACHTWYG
jgi:hypothetical protein